MGSIKSQRITSRFPKLVHAIRKAIGGARIIDHRSQSKAYEIATYIVKMSRDLHVSIGTR